MPAPDSVLKLCETFADHRDHYRSGNYNEAQLRKEFLDPFFAALGWDMDNAQGLAPQYRDVIHEDALRIGPHVKAPDCAFTLHGQRKFFLEAKKPAVNIKTDIDPAYQLRRYAWSAKMPLSILSDFEEFAIYDTRIKPAKGDPSSKARTFYCTFDQYAEKWDEIAAIFSRDAILKGSFDKYADSNKKKKGTAEVDAAFLEEIERWRDLLARNLALRNPALSVRDLNFAVQKTIDRLVFLRICEDRGTEDYGKLRSIANGTQTYPRLLELFRAADQRYNSGLFHFSKEKGQAEEPDTLTPHLLLDDKTLKDIIVHLYYPDSPYEFSVLPADILGSVYEQFLGKVINLTAGHRAVVEDKPEVKKAGGVFYTPSYIVDYIVKQTVGPLIEGKTPKQIDSIRVLDPACGSGSFLIVVYQFLLDWYHQYYISHDPEKLAKGKSPVLVQARVGGWALTTAERKRILLAHVFGVDIDSQAVEVTKLSLLLKVLEGETTQSVQRELIHQRVLPDLGDNIKCGNSLIGSDFYAQPGLPEMDADAHLRVNVFDWEGKDGFSEIMKAGGFDAVVGNPPYAYRNATDAALRSYYLTTYETAEGNFDIYKFFIERASMLLRTKGKLGMIVSATFLVQPTFARLRSYLLKTFELNQLCPLGPNVFANATVDTCIIEATKSKRKISNQIEIIAPELPTEISIFKSYKVRQTRFEANPSQLFDYRLSEQGADLVRRLFTEFPTIETKFEFGVGINTGYIKDDLTAPVRIDKRYHPMVPGTGISRYGCVNTVGWIMYDPEYVKSRGDRGRSLPPEKFFSQDKILVVRTRNLSLARRVIATLDDEKNYNLNRLSNIIARDGFDLKGLLGVLNSRLLNWLFATRFYDYEIKPVYLRQSPVCNINSTALITLVEKMLDLHKQRAAARTPHEQTALDRQISATDIQIDRLVYDLYGLTEEEIKLVEGA
jgi:SAM-dependent methyltransferase